MEDEMEIEIKKKKTICGLSLTLNLRITRGFMGHAGGFETEIRILHSGSFHQQTGGITTDF